MSDHSTIEWTDATFNPIRGFQPNRWMCRKISPGCDNCYASTQNHRWGGQEYPGVVNPDVRLDEKTLGVPLTWREPRMVFVCSMTDLFGEWVPVEWIGRIFNVMGAAKQHQFQVLTKRPRRMMEVVRAYYQATDQQPFPNVWLGTSIELDRFAWRAEYLRQSPAVVRFISAEPLLGPLPSLDLYGIDWLITGGESGARHRPIDLEWVRDLRDRAQATHTAFFHKQWGGRTHATGGRELDGREWNEFPKAREAVSV